MKKILIASVLSVALLLPVAAQAQSKKVMNANILVLQQEMAILKRQISEATSKKDASKMRIMFADVMAKMGQIDRQMRLLTGRLEELEERQRGFDTALEGLRKEMDLKIQSLKMAGIKSSQGLEPELKGQGLGASLKQPQITVKKDTVVTVTGKEQGAVKKAVPAVIIELPAGSDKVQYDYAFAFIPKQEFDKGEQALQKFIKANPKSSLIANARYWLGRVYQRQNKVPQAAAEFFAVVQNHGDSSKYPDALVDLADVLIKLGGEKSEACRIIDEFMGLQGKVSMRLKSRADRMYKQAACQ